MTVRRRMARLPLRVRLVAGFSATMFLVLAAMSAFVYWRVHFALDRQLKCTLDGGRVWIDEDWVLVETKGGLRTSPADTLLGSLGPRPRSFSKYVSAASLLRDDIPDNDVRRLRGRQLHAQEAIA
jgi:hypothetical protein